MNLLFADDAALATDCPVKLQKIVDVLVEVTDAYGQEVSVMKKTEVMWVGKLDPGAQPPRVDIRITGQQLKQVTEFRYVGSIETEKASMDKEVLVSSRPYSWPVDT